MPPRIATSTGDVQLGILRNLRADIKELIAQIETCQPLGLSPHTVDLKEYCRWATLAAAQSNGYLTEFKTYLKNRAKNRVVYGDVAQVASGKKKLTFSSGRMQPPCRNRCRSSRASQTTPKR